MRWSFLLGTTVGLLVTKLRLAFRLGATLKSPSLSPLKFHLNKQVPFGTFLNASVSTDARSITTRNPRLFLALCALLNGSSYVFTKMLQDSVAPSLLTFLRFLLATTCFVPTLCTTPFQPAVAKSAMAIGVTQAIGFITQAVALRYASASKVAFFTCLSVILCPLLDYLSSIGRNNTRITKTSVSWDGFIAPILALMGVACLEFGGMEQVRWTDALIIFAPLAFASGYRKSERLAKEFPCVIYYNTGIQMVTVSAISALWALRTGHLPVSPRQLLGISRRLSHPRILFGLLHAGLLTTALTQLLEQKAIRVLSAGDTALIYTLEPLFAAAISVVLLGEAITSATVAGALFITAACVWSALGATSSSFGQFLARLQLRFLTPRREKSPVVLPVDESPSALISSDPHVEIQPPASEETIAPAIAEAPVDQSAALFTEEADSVVPTIQAASVVEDELGSVCAVAADPSTQPRGASLQLSNPDAVILKNVPIRATPPSSDFAEEIDDVEVLRTQQAISSIFLSTTKLR